MLPQGIQNAKEAPTMDANTTTETKAVETAAPAKPKRAVKTPGQKPVAKTAASAVKPKPMKADAPKSEKAPVTNAHVDAGIDVNAYTGLSKFVNQNRRTKIMTGVERSTGSLTDRMQRGLYALRKTYGGKQWPAKGFDNGILSELAGAGLIELHGGITENIDGHSYMIDAATPVVGKITAKGMKYGLAA
jgi:hypothetical protein